MLPERKIVTRDKEVDWLGRQLANMEKGETIVIVAEVDGKVIGHVEVNLQGRSMRHVGELNIVIKAEYRDRGIGTEMIKTIIEESRKAGLRVITLETFPHNQRAKNVYEKLGFKETGRIPDGFYRKGKYIDTIIMTLRL